MNRARSLGGGVTGYPAGKRELLEQFFQARLVLRNVWVEFAVGTFKVNISDHSGSTMSWASQKDGVQVELLDQTITMRVDEVQSWSCSPMTQKPRLNVFEC